MGIFIDYTFSIDCHETELLQRMTRLRDKLLQLPFDSVSEVIAVEPAYHSLYLRMLRKAGGKIPDCVQERLGEEENRLHGDWRLMVAPATFMGVDKKISHRFLQPAIDFCKTTKLWRREDLPEKIDDGFALTLYRGAFELEFASVMLRHGHLIVVQPCEGCETFAIGLSTFRVEGTPFWLGSGFTKTMYATRFVQAHESICRALDFARDEGLLLSAADTCGYYNHRDWSQSADIVNRETTMTKVITDAFRAGIAGAQAKGKAIEDISSPSTRNYNIIRFDEANDSE